MIKLDSKIYASPEHLSYMVVTDAELLGGGYKGKFVVHVEGNARVIYKLWKQYEDEISPEGVDVYYSLKKLEYFINHSEEVVPGLYKYRRKET